MDTEALAGFAMPARASTFNSIDCTNSLGGSGGPPRGPPDAENRRFSELIKRIHTNERRSPGGLRPKRRYGPFGSLFLIIGCWDNIQGVFFILTKYILKLLGPQSTEEAGLGQNLFLRSWEIFWLPWLWYPSYLTTQYNGLLFSLENGQNAIYSHMKVGKMVHEDKNGQHPVKRL